MLAGNIRFFDVHVEEVGHDADLGADLARDGRALLQAVDDVGLVAVEGLQEQGDAGGAGGGGQLAQLRQEQIALKRRAGDEWGKIGQGRDASRLRHEQHADGIEFARPARAACGWSVWPFPLHGIGAQDAAAPRPPRRRSAR